MQRTQRRQCMNVAEMVRQLGHRQAGCCVARVSGHSRRALRLVPAADASRPGSGGETAPTQIGPEFAEGTGEWSYNGCILLVTSRRLAGCYQRCYQSHW